MSSGQGAIASRPQRWALSVEAETRDSWIPGLAGLARNDGRGLFVIPAHAGIQGVWNGLGILFLSSRLEVSCGKSPGEVWLVLRSVQIKPKSYKDSTDCALGRSRYRVSHRRRCWNSELISTEPNRANWNVAASVQSAMLGRSPATNGRPSDSRSSNTRSASGNMLRK